MKSVKTLVANIAIVRPNRDDYQIFTTDDVWRLDIPTDNYHHCGFIEPGNIIAFDNKKHIVSKVWFRIIPKDSSIREIVDLYSEEPTGVSNCTIFVEVQDYTG